MRYLEPGKSYRELCDSLDLNIPEFFNIGTAAIDRHASDPEKLALIYETPSGEVSRYTFAQLKNQSNRLANSLRRLGLQRGDRLAVLLSQRPETAICHMTAFRMGAIALPLFALFGPEALEYRLSNSEAKFIVTDGANVHKVLAIRDQLPHLEKIIVTDPDGNYGDLDYDTLIEEGSEDFEPIQTHAEDPALILYTSGTTGPPKGALHAHRVMFGHFPAVEFNHDFFPQEGDLFWTPADWAWAGGLLDVLFPSLHYGIPVVAYRFNKFVPENAFDLIARHKVRNMFLPPTALKMMRQVENPQEKYNYNIRSIASGGECLGKELIEWGRETFGVTINEFWGQTEANLLGGSSHVVSPVKPGSIGLPNPGHVVEVIDEEGNILPPNVEGEFAAKKPDPVFLLGYWKNPEATAAKYRGDWWLTGDTGYKDEDGYLWFAGRNDDLITSGGYRIGPSEIEDCLIQHPAVSLAAVVGSPDAVRGDVVKAFLVLKTGFEGNDALAKEIQSFVKSRLAAYEYPRLVEFVDSLPMTMTGKIRRKPLREAEIEKFKQSQQEN